MPAPRWFKDAIATAVGWAHPLTGEQLTGRLPPADAGSAVEHYVPNAGKNSFLEATDVPYRVGVQTLGRRVIAELQSLSPVDGSVTWTLGNQAPVVGGTRFVGLVDTFDKFDLEVSATLEGEIVVSETVEITAGLESRFPPSTLIPATIVGTVQDGVQLECTYAFDGHGSAVEITHQWYTSATEEGERTAIDGAIYHLYTVVTADVGLWLHCAVTATSANGVAVSEVSGGPVIAA